MNILYIHQYFKTPKEPGSTRSYWLAKELVKNGHSVTILTSSSIFESRIHNINIDGINVIYIRGAYGQNMSFYRRSMAFINFMLKVTRVVLKNNNIDLVIATSTPLTIGIPALIKKWFHKTPFIFEVRDVWPEAVVAIGAIKNRFVISFLYYLEKIIYKNSSAIIPLSSGMKKSIINRYHNLKMPIVTIPNIAEINQFEINKEKTQGGYLRSKIGFLPRFSILYAGTFGEVNGINYLINLAKETYKLDKTLVFILIGGGSLKKEVIKKAKEFEILNRNVFIFDSIPKEDIPVLYNEVSMGSSFVIPIKELWLNSANKFFDTLASGKPVLINYGGWQKKVIEENNVGYVLPIETNNESVFKFVEYTKNTDLVSVQQEKALILAKKEYSLEVAVEKYLKILNQINFENQLIK